MIPGQSTRDPCIREPAVTEHDSDQDLVRNRFRAYRRRIEELQSYARLDGIPVRSASEHDFWSFFGSIPYACKAGVVLLDNGNLRAVWKGEESTRVGVEFLGGRSIE